MRSAKLAAVLRGGLALWSRSVSWNRSILRSRSLWCSSMLCGALLAGTCLTERAWGDPAATTAATTAVSPAAATATSEGGLEEITVTAERFTSTIQNTPISISALSGDQLTAAGITRIQDISKEVPGLSMRYAAPGLTEYEARGLASNGGAAPTVGFYLDEIPLSPPAVSQSGKVVIDPNLYDVERVEVLRGPQGTLYGSGSMGGTVKVLTNQPKLDTFRRLGTGHGVRHRRRQRQRQRQLDAQFSARQPGRCTHRAERPVSQRLDR